MTPNLFILASCRKPELLRASTLVFDSLRVGFPTAKVVCYVNKMEWDFEKAISNAAEKADCRLQETDTISHDWIEHLAERMDEPFWVCDTDLVFHDRVEDWRFTTGLAGRLIPQYRNEWLHAVERPRLHPSLLHIDPVRLQADMVEWYRPLPRTIFTPAPNLWRPQFVPMGRGRTAFYDTGAMLYHAVGGTPFDAAHLDAYSHAFFGTIEDIVLPHLENAPAMAARRREFFAHPEKQQGCWREQQCWYAQRLA